MKLILSPNQIFPVESDLVLIPLTSSWTLKLLGNASTPVFDFMKNAPQSASYTYQLKPNSAYNYYTSQGYSNLKVRSFIDYIQGDSTWLSIASDWFPVSNYTAINSIEYKDISFYIQPSLNISQGVHLANVKFYIEGEKNGIVQTLSTFQIPVKLNVFEDGYFYSPGNFNFYYDGTSPTNQSLQVGGNNWVVNVPNGLILIGSGVILNPDGSYRASGSSLKDFTLGLASNISDILDDEENIILPITINYPSSVYTIPVNIQRTEGVYPTKINFNIQNGEIDELFQLIHINRSDDFTISTLSPSNLGFETIDTNQGKKLKIFVIDPKSHGVGAITRFVTLEFSDRSYTIEILITTGNQFDLGLSDKTIFTHSMKDLVFKSNNLGSNIDMLLNIVGESTNFKYTFPFFKGKAKKNIGRILSNYSSLDLSQINISSPGITNFTGSFPLRYFNINIKEKKQGVELLNYSKSNIPFLVGYEPKILDNKAILQHNHLSRFTKDSFALVSVYSQTARFNYSILVNGNAVYSTANQYGYIKIIALNFNQYNVSSGDVVDFILTVDNEELKKTFVIYPEPLYNINIVYIDSFGLFSTINFTGKPSMPEKEFSFKLENYNELLELFTRKHFEKEETKIILNTGYILKSQSLEVAELMKSPKAWIQLNNNTLVEVIPTTKTQHSNDDFLTSYDIEFIINKEKYAQDYNF